jgi:hypothetical protein
MWARAAAVTAAAEVAIAPALSRRAAKPHCPPLLLALPLPWASARVQPRPFD